MIGTIRTHSYDESAPVSDARGGQRASKPKTSDDDDYSEYSEVKEETPPQENDYEQDFNCDNERAALVNREQ